MSCCPKTGSKSRVQKYEENKQSFIIGSSICGALAFVFVLLALYFFISKTIDEKRLLKMFTAGKIPKFEYVNELSELNHKNPIKIFGGVIFVLTILAIVFGASISPLEDTYFNRDGILSKEECKQCDALREFDINKEPTILSVQRGDTLPENKLVAIEPDAQLTVSYSNDSSQTLDIGALLKADSLTLVTLPQFKFVVQAPTTVTLADIPSEMQSLITSQNIIARLCNNHVAVVSENKITIRGCCGRDEDCTSTQFFNELQLKTE